MERGAVKGRFAPTPSGRMHLGNLLCALLAWLSARAEGGRVVLRIEDLDAMRSPRSYADLLEDDLRWLRAAPPAGHMGPITRASAPLYTNPPWPIWRSRGLSTPAFAAAPSSTRPRRPTSQTGGCSTPAPAGI